MFSKYLRQFIYQNSGLDKKSFPKLVHEELGYTGADSGQVGVPQYGRRHPLLVFSCYQP